MSTRLRIHTLLRRYLQRHGEPSRGHMAEAVDRVWQTLDQRGTYGSPDVLPDSVASAFRRKSPLVDVTVTSALRRKPRVAFVAAAVIVIAAMATAILWRPADNGLFRVADGEVHAKGGTIRSNGGGAGAVLTLQDGSRVEMRSQSELALDRASDGLRIRLIRGGIIVDAATQRTGHLYVQTKDVTVSVVGTVFLVNADEHGSRVAVIEGEVRVQQGATEKKLLPGEQVATSPAMPRVSIKEEIAWARNAPLLVGLLQQSVSPPAIPAQQNPLLAKPAFEVVTIRPSASGSGSGGGRGAGGLASYAPYRIGCTGYAEIDPGRFFIKNVTALTLIMRAHGPSDRNCTSFTRDLLTGGLDWVATEQFNIEARIPQGTPVYTVRQFENNNAPVLQAMLQNMLADRFKLVVRHQMKEMPVEFLKLGTTRNAAQLAEMAAATMTRSPRAEWAGLFDRVAKGLETLKEGTVSTEGDGLWGINASVSELVSYLARLTGKPVLDRTGLKVQFMFDLQYERVDDGLGPFQGYGRPLSAASLASLRKALREQLGLELESGTAPVEVLVIDRVERPTEN
jgi:uncharacterized protein (TIGR03435 family)